MACWVVVLRFEVSEFRRFSSPRFCTFSTGHRYPVFGHPKKEAPLERGAGMHMRKTNIVNGEWSMVNGAFMGADAFPE
jgi:hypothetical protein